MVTKIFDRTIKSEIVRYLDSNEAIVIHGARQVGKTTLLKQIIKENIKGNSFYFDLEFPELLEVCNKGAEYTYNFLLEKGADKNDRIFLIVDEIQYLDEPTRFIKLIHDHYPTLKLIATGSSSFEIKRKFKESLVGRTVNFELYPLSFEEFLSFKEKKVIIRDENLQPINNELIPLAEEFIKFGGFPRVALEESEEKKKKYISQIISTYIRKDIREIGNIRNISKFNNLIEVLASQSGQLINITELTNTLGINRITLMEYLNILEATYIIKLLKPFHKNIRSELSKNPKIFFMDTGLMHILWLKEFPKTIHGNSFETSIYTELFKTGTQLNFWRTAQKQEVDFIVTGKRIIAIEAKHSFKKSRHLNTFMKKYNASGFVVGLKGKKDGKYPWEMTRVVLKNKI